MESEPSAVSEGAAFGVFLLVLCADTSVRHITSPAKKASVKIKFFFINFIFIPVRTRIQIEKMSV